MNLSIAFGLIVCLWRVPRLAAALQSSRLPPNAPRVPWSATPKKYHGKPVSFARPSCSVRLAATPIASSVVDIGKTTPRQISTMEEWAATYGVQRAEGLQLTPTYSASNNNDDDDLQNQDMSVMTTQDLPASSPVLSVPAGMVLYSLTAQQEFSPMPDVDDLFEKVYGQHRLPYFYLFVKVLAEYQAGDQSPWYPWLNSLPRMFANGACLTFFCFECLPPLVRRLALQERTRFSQFFRALKYVPFLSDEIKNNRKLAKWAFAVVFTRSLEVGPGDVRIVPMADMVRM